MENKINKSSLLEGLQLKDGVYFKSGVAVLQQSQLEERKQQEESEDVEQLQMETQIYVSSILSEYFSFVDFIEKNQEKIIRDCEKISNDIIKEFIPEQNKGAMDYYIRLSFLALYKYVFERYDIIYDSDIYQKILQYTEKETLKFRQSIGTEISIDVASIVDQWWIEIQAQGKFHDTEDDEIQEDILDLDAEDMIAKQTKTMD